MALDQSEILALRVVLKDVQQMRRDLGGVRKDLTDIRSENARASSTQAALNRSITGTGRAAKQSYDAASRSARTFHDDTRRLHSAYSSLRGVVLGAAGAFGTVYGAARLGLSAIEKFEQKRGFSRSLAFNLGAGASGVAAGVTSFANKQGLDLGGVRGTAASLAGTGNVDPSVIVPIIRAFTALGGAGGANTNQIGRGFEQLAQIAAQGQLQGDELRSINENLIPLRRILIDAGLGARLGSQTNPIQWREIEKALLAFGQRADVQKLLDQQAEQATASIQRLENAISNDLLPAVGDALTPVVKTAAASIGDWVKNTRPEDIKAATERVIEFGKGVADHAPEIIGFMLTMKAYSFFAQGRLTASTLNAAAALDTLAVSARSGGVMGGSGGFGGVSGVGRGIRGFLGGVGRTGAMMGGAYVGGEIASRFSDNPLVQIGGSIAGGAAANGAIRGASAIGGAIRNLKNGLDLAGKVARFGGGAADAAGGAGIAGAAGTAGLATVIIGGTMLSVIALLEKATGTNGEDDSIFSNLMYGGIHKGSGGSIRATKRWAEQADKSFMNRWAIRKKIENLRKFYGDAVLAPHILANYLTAEEKKAIGFNPDLSARSPRASAYDSRAAETEVRSVRYSL